MQREVIKLTPCITKLPRLMNVAAYARVSSGKDAMLHSLSSQVSYYSKLIQENPRWKYAGVYADEAKTGTKDERPEFQRILKDCKDGKIDLIITKSISRFARNTVTILQTVRELKEIGVNIYFEREKIYSMSPNGELMLTLLASFAQEESRSVSENCKWRIRNRFKTGDYYNFNMLGYQITNKKLEKNSQEAEIVKMIFNDFMSGMGKNAIMKKLVSMGCQTKRHKNWGEETVTRILRNEKYAGDMLLQKYFKSNHIDKKDIKNIGQLPQYHVKNSHEPIIDRATFEAVQEELKRRTDCFAAPHKQKQPYCFTSKVICGNCGKCFHRKTAHLGKKYEKTVWGCSTYMRLGKSSCHFKQIPEEILMSLASEVLGNAKFDESDFIKRIAKVIVIDNGVIKFVFYDGTEVIKQWHYKSRSESWDEEKRQKAREYYFQNLERKKLNG